jgi:hypothetical protein
MSESYDSYEMPYFYLEQGKPNHTFRIPHNSPSREKLLKEDLEKKYPREKSPAVSNKTTRQMIQEMGTSKSGRKLKFDERGDYKTDDPEEAIYAYNGLFGLPGCHIRFHPNSKKLPPEWAAKLKKKEPVVA